MKSCEEYGLLISAFLDGELSGDEKAEVAEHLAVCPVCQQYFDDLVAIHDVLEQEEAPVPEGFADRVMDQVRATPRNRPVIRFPHWRQWTALAACCAVVLLAVWTLPSWSARKSGEAEETTVYQEAAYDEAVPAPAGEPVAQASGGADSADSLEMKPAEEETGQESSVMKRAVESAAEPACCDAAPAPTEAASPFADDHSNSLPGTVSAGGPAARAWVEETLELEWEPGRTYPLTEEEYASLLDALADAEEAFRVEPDGGCRLVAEEG